MRTTLGGRVLRRMRYRREGARSVRSSVIIVVLLLVFVVAVDACGGSEDDAYVGYWRMPPVEKSFLDYDLLQVRRAGDAYEVRFDTLPWHRASSWTAACRCRARGEWALLPASESTSR